MKSVASQNAYKWFIISTTDGYYSPITFVTV